MGISLEQVTPRIADRRDIDALLALWLAADSVPSITDTALDVANVIALDCAHVLVAEADGQLIGSVIATFDGWRGNIYRLAVHPDYRRRRVATRLLEAADRWLTEKGAKRVTALVVEAHPLAVGFWNASGYELDERIVRYVRTLDPAP